MNKTKIVEDTDAYAEQVQYMGKNILQWIDDLHGTFTASQIYNMIKNGVNLNKIVLSLNEDKNINESSCPLDDVVTIADLLTAFRGCAKIDDKLIFRDAKSKKTFDVVELKSKGGIAVIDIMPSDD